MKILKISCFRQFFNGVKIMKKNFKFYAVTWALLFAVYNVLAFAVGFKNTANFWAAYIASAIAMLLQLICAKYLSNPENLTVCF